MFQFTVYDIPSWHSPPPTRIFVFFNFLFLFFYLNSNTVIRPEAGRLYAIIPRLSMEWSLKYNVKLLDVPFTSYFQNAFKFTAGDHTRLPHLTIFNNRKIEIDNNEGHNYELRYTGLYMEVNKTYCIEQNQKYIGGGKYVYNIVIDGVEVLSKINTNAKQYYNVKLYMCMVNRVSAPVEITNFEHTNFL